MVEHLYKNLTETFETAKAVEAIKVTEATEAKILLKVNMFYIECLLGPQRPFMPDFAKGYHPDKFVIFAFGVKMN